MARIGDYIDPSLNRYDPTPYLQAQGNATRTIGAGISNAIGDFGDKLKEQREKKNEVKANSKLIESYMTLFPDSAGAFAPLKDALSDEDTPISERHAISKTAGDLISAYLDKSRSDALMGLEVQKLGLMTREQDLAEQRFSLGALNESSAAESVNATAINEALALKSSIEDAVNASGGRAKLPEKSISMIEEALDAGNGPAALAAAKAAADVVKPFTGPKDLKLEEVPVMLPDGSPGFQQVWSDGSGQLWDIDGQPLGDGVLPPPDGVQPIIPPTPRGVRPAATPAQAKTPTEQALDEARLKKTQIESQVAEAGLDKQTDMKASAKNSAEGALALIEKLKKHPGFSGAVGLSVTPGWLPATDRKGAEAIINQLKGQAFLNAIQQLRGLGALSDAEGAKLEQASVRLNPNQSEKDFKAALDDYEKTIRDAIGRLGGESSSVPTESSAAAKLRALRGQ
jgi:hypothetical protein